MNKQREAERQLNLIERELREIHIRLELLEICPIEEILDNLDSHVDYSKPIIGVLDYLDNSLKLLRKKFSKVTGKR